jgi:hypothetical protein
MLIATPSHKPTNANINLQYPIFWACTWNLWGESNFGYPKLLVIYKKWCTINYHNRMYHDQSYHHMIYIDRLYYQLWSMCRTFVVYATSQRPMSTQWPTVPIEWHLTDVGSSSDRSLTRAHARPLGISLLELRIFGRLNGEHCRIHSI